MRAPLRVADNGRRWWVFRDAEVRSVQRMGRWVASAGRRVKSPRITSRRHCVYELQDALLRAFKAATRSAMNHAAPAQVQRPSMQASPVSPIPKEGYDGPRVL